VSAVSVAALAVIASGILHATWNALAKAADDRVCAVALMGAAQAGLAIPVLLVLAPAPPLLAGASVAVHVVYLALLTRSYRLGDFSQVYPLARGLAPLLVAAVAVTALGERLSPLQLLGLAAICGGLGALAFAGRSRRADRPAVVAALLTGVTIAVYTVIDGLGARSTGDPFGYTAWLFTGLGLACAAWGLTVRGPRAVVRSWRPGLAAGVASAAGYATVIWAQSVAPLAMVAALRETGVVAGAVIGVVAFHERMAAARVLAAGVVVLGVVLLNVTP
jgi:drug/metabolite transporter (DMT)-like permease